MDQNNNDDQEKGLLKTEQKFDYEYASPDSPKQKVDNQILNSSNPYNP